MTTLADSIELEAEPDKVIEWLMNLHRHYQEWHPDHIRCTGVAGTLNEGDAFCFEEKLHGKVHRIRGRVTRIDKNRVIEYKCLFPVSMVCSKGSFKVDGKGKCSVFTATLSFRFGWIFLRLARSRVESLKKHMQEEGRNLKQLLEN